MKLYVAELLCRGIVMSRNCYGPLLEGRTVLIFKGGNWNDPVNFRPITCLPTITKIVTLSIHKRMRGWLFGSVENSILDC